MIQELSPLDKRLGGGSGLAAKRERVEGLDSIRFVCALWVVFSHFGFIPLADHLTNGSKLMSCLRGLYNNAFCGVAAVIVFFLISGFCIHYPFRNAESISIKAFLSRRYLRIGIPFALITCLVYSLRSSEMSGFYNAILWSLVAELIYYTLYPLLFPLLKNQGWPLVAIANGAALAVVFLKPHALNYHAFGPYLTWVVGLPCWLLGCLLAGSYSTSPIPGWRRLWFWRCFIWFLASASSILRFHCSIGFPWTLNLFAIACFIWLQTELRWFHAHPPNRFLEGAGAWSYSLYLCHVPACLLFASFGIANLWGRKVEWLLQVAFCLATSYLFFLIVEKPAHRLACHVAQRVQR